MALSDEIKRIKQQLEELKKKFDRVGKDSIDNLIRSLENGNASLEEWQFNLDAIEDKADKISNSFDYVTKSFQDAVNELSRQNQYLKSSKDIISEMSKKAQEALSMRRGEISIDEKALKSAKDKISLQERQLRNNLANISAATAEGRARRAEIQSVLDNLKDYKEGLEGTLETNKKINKELGVAPQIAAGLEKAMAKIGLPNLGIADALDKTKRLGQAAARAGDDGFKPMSTFIKEVGKNLKDTLSTANLIQFALGALIAALKSVDDGAGQMAKQMNMTYSDALALRREFTGMANTSMDVAVNTKGLQESYMAIGKSLGSNAVASEKTLVAFTKLRDQAGYTNEQLAELNKLSLVNGKSLEDNTKEILGGAQAYASRKGLIINEKDVLNDVVNASASLKLSLGGSADALAKAAVQTRAVGINLETAAHMADQLLQFESSIENELSAELLVGKDLNFERARQLALNNDIAGAAEEIAKQVGTSAQFAEMNAIQQEAIAEAAGMTKDQLAQSLMDREALAALSGVEGKDAKEKFDNLVKQVGMEEAKKRLGNEQLATQYAQQNTQERFAQAVEKLKEVFVNVANALMPILDIFAGVFQIIGPIVGVLGKVVGFAIEWKNVLLPIVGAFVTLKFLFDGINKAGMLANVMRKAGLITEQQMLFLHKAQTNEENVKLGLAARNKIYEKASLASMVAKSAAAKVTAFYENSIIGSLIKQISLGAKNLAQAVATAAAWAIANPFSAMLGLAIAGAVAGGIYALTKGDDVFSRGTGGGGGYGQRMLMDKGSIIALNDSDNVIATTNPIKPVTKANDMYSQGTVTVANSTAPKSEPAPAPAYDGSNVVKALKDGFSKSVQVSRVS